MPFGRVAFSGMTGHGVRVNYLLVAGGAGGQTGVAFATDGGAGCGGTVKVGTGVLLKPGFSGQVLIGAGGADGGATPGAPGNRGAPTSIAGLDATPSASGLDLGLGGGYNLSGVQTYGWGGPSSGFGGGAPGSGFSHDGQAGKAGGAGGGAAGGATGAIPGPGLVSSISGASVEYGRGGVTRLNFVGGEPPGTGGYGGYGSNAPGRGTAGTGGIAIVSYPFGNGIARATGGVVTILGGFFIHTFTFNDFFTVNV